jgi:hypothetical protein
MRATLLMLSGAAALLTSGSAAADEIAFEDRLILDAGRRTLPAPEVDAYRVFVTGEHQIRYQAERSFPLIATASAAQRAPGLVEQSLGQNQFVYHWLRATPHAQLGTNFELVAQLDLGGLVVGDKAHDVHADQTPRDAVNGFSNLQLRWLYADIRLPFGELRLGQQPNHWAMGILANDGDHPLRFGDYRYGQQSERVAFTTKPGNGDMNLLVAADLVYRDQLATLTRGDRAAQGVLSVFWENHLDRLGVFTTFRHQSTDRAGTSIDTDLVSIDLHGKVVAPVPGTPDAWLYGEAEAAYQVGSTDLGRAEGQAKTQIRAYGGAAKIGGVHSKRQGAKTYGDIAAELEIGYASGDADPYDGTNKRFTFDPNHRIGLILFDEILRFQTARSATASTDPALVSRPPTYAEPSNGGVFGAEYINPTFTYRPREWLDLKSGAVIAQSTAEIVDPYRLSTTGSYVNYRGESPKKRDLGIELDGGVEARRVLAYDLTGSVGAQAGVLFPGDALDMPVQWIAIGRVGLEF